ncbi:MAG TPA: hypothetical protein VKZ53_27585 [Candidatus Angelobacter sp.]|nr:hypothetical protein [Candidatus Angelobacter sp.]
MIRTEQYEVWTQKGERWEMLGSFQELDMATALTKNRSGRQRIICVTYEYGKMISQESIAELGTPRAEAQKDY